MTTTADQQNRPDERTKSPDWMERLANYRMGLATLSFGESTLVPIPLEAIVIPLMVGHPKRAITIAIWIWLGCLVGAFLFYFVGLWLAEPVVLPTIEWLGLKNEFSDMQDRLSDGGLFWAVFTVSLLPAPMQLATLGAGAVGGNPLVFIAAIALSRGIRYFGLAILSQFVGERLVESGVPKRILIPSLFAVLFVGWVIYQLI